MLFEVVVRVVGVFHYRDFCLEGMLAPELSDSCRHRLYRGHEYLQLRHRVCQHWRLRRLQGVHPLRPWQERDLRGSLVAVLDLGGSDGTESCRVHRLASSEWTFHCHWWRGVSSDHKTRQDTSQQPGKGKTELSSISFAQVSFVASLPCNSTFTFNSSLFPASSLASR